MDCLNTISRKVCIILLCNALGMLNVHAFNVGIDHASYAAIVTSDTIPPQINKEMLEMFQNFKQRGAITESFYYQLLQNPDLRHPGKWRQVYEEYRQALLIQEDPLEHEEFVKLVEEEVAHLTREIQETTDIKETTVDEKSDVEADELVKPADPVVIQEDPPEEVQEEIIISEELISETIIPDPEKIPVEDETRHIADTRIPVKPDAPVKATVPHTNVRYHVQIAASLVPLDADYLKRLYDGPRQIHHFREDQWEKYYIGEFYAFDQAREELRKTQVADAFIIAYFNNQKLIPYKARQVERVFTNTTLQTFHHVPGEQYRIQIAASIRPLTMQELQSILPDIGKAGIIYEDGWFKYSIPGAETLSESWKIASSINVEGAFVVRYRKGQLIPLR